MPVYTVCGLDYARERLSLVIDADSAAAAELEALDELEFIAGVLKGEHSPDPDVRYQHKATWTVLGYYEGYEGRFRSLVSAGSVTEAEAVARARVHKEDPYLARTICGVFPAHLERADDYAYGDGWASESDLTSKLANIVAGAPPLVVAPGPRQRPSGLAQRV